jgi:hypothetical protein
MTTRRTLPQRRACETFKLRHGSHQYHVTTGRYPADYVTVGEVFISTNNLAILMSLAAQHGCSFEIMRDALTREHDGAPSTIAGAVADRLAEEA